MKTILVTALPFFAATTLLASPAYAFIGSDNSTQIPVGYCVAEIATVQDPATNVFYKWDASDEKGVKVGYPLNYWDVPVGRDSANKEGNGYMNMSVYIDKVTSGNCLTDVAFRIGQRGTTPGAPSAVGVANKYDYSGSWSGPHIWQPGGNGATDRAIGVLYTQKMTQSSPKIITGVTLIRGTPCAAGKRRNGLANNVTDTCVGAWKGEGGGGADSYYVLQITSVPYEKPPMPTAKSVSGTWKRVAQCDGCEKVTYQATVGVTKGSSISDETETSKSLSATIGVAFSAGAEGIAKQSVSASVTGTLAEARRKALIDSFDQSTTTQASWECSKGALWQWTTTVNLTDNSSSTALSGDSVCTTKNNTPPNEDDLYWNPK